MTRNKTHETTRSPIISTGIFKGMRLATPAGDKTRPTSSKARAAAMNAVQSRLIGAAFCDLFAGSGAVGIEALSRGAAECTFAESAPAALDALRRNVTECERRCLAQKQPPPVIRILAQDVQRLLTESIEKAQTVLNNWNQRAFDIIWADPPYALASSFLPELLIFADAVLEDDGILMVETGNAVEHGVPSGAATLRFKSEKKYGGTFITSWEKKNDHSEGQD
ncbi:MAG: hypothetical protein EBU49_09155 [Proteobacteria bacterium]|nr:hypothetical protein [Pseudomonadota bacterium]